MPNDELEAHLEDVQGLQTLSFSDTMLTSSQISMLNEFLQINTIVKALEFCEASFEGNSIQTLFEALGSNTTLETLNFDSGNADSEDAKALGKVLQKNSTLQYVSLVANNIGDEGAKALSIALQNNTTLQQLYLGFNEIGSEGAKALGEALQKNLTLQYLRLDDNNIGDQGAKALGEALQKNHALHKLFLSQNKIGDEGVMALVKSLDQNKIITAGLGGYGELLKVLMKRNQDYVQKFADYWSKTQSSSEKVLNLGDIKYFLGCDKALLKKELSKLNASEDLAWNKTKILEYWQNSAFKILVLCKNQNLFNIPVDMLKLIFSFLSPYDFATKDHITFKNMANTVTDTTTSFIEEVKDEVLETGTLPGPLSDVE